jgi:aspartate-semialdehyde dehydrogenase
MVVSTYQAVSGAGKEAMDELNDQVSALYNHREVPIEIFGRQMAFNVLPAIGTFDDNGDTDEELKMRNESRKMLHLPTLAVACTCVRVPVYNGHSVSVNLELGQELSADAARAILRGAPGVLLVDDPTAKAIPTPIDASGQDATLVGRIRRDTSVEFGLSLFCCADNLRKGAATNAVQIAEILLRDYL